MVKERLNRRIGVRNVISYTRLMMQSFLVFRDSPIIPLRLSPNCENFGKSLKICSCNPLLIFKSEFCLCVFLVLIWVIHPSIHQGWVIGLPSNNISVSLCFLLAIVSALVKSRSRLNIAVDSRGKKVGNRSTPIRHLFDFGDMRSGELEFCLLSQKWPPEGAS